MSIFEIDWKDLDSVGEHSWGAVRVHADDERAAKKHFREHYSSRRMIERIRKIK